MKKHPTTRQITVFAAITVLSVFFAGCGSQAKLAGSNGESKKAGAWYNNREWLNGLQLKPHESINREEFSRQYHTNKVWWDKAFDFMKTHNLDELKAGSYVIDSGNVIATVSEAPTKEKGNVNFEAHRNFNDLQYIIKGKAQMGVAPIADPEAKATIPYNTRSDTETFAVTGGQKYYVAEPGTFFIFTPKDIHQPAFRQEGYESVKKVVIKVRVP